MPPGQYGELSPNVVFQRKDADGDKAISYSSEITLYGPAMRYVFDALIASEDPAAVVNIRVFDDCCDERRLIFRGRVRAKNLEYCKQDGKICELTTTADDAGLASDLERCLRGKLVNNNTPDFRGSGQSFWNYDQHPKIPYCNDLRPGVLRHFIVVGGILFGIILATLVLIIALLSLVAIIISAIISAVGALAALVGGNGVDGDTNKIDDTMKVINEVFDLIGDLFRDTLPAFMTGCGYEHVAPLVRDYIMNACQQCGQEVYGDPFAVDFASSILNDSQSLYYSMALLYAPNEEGFAPKDGTQNDNITPSRLTDFWTRNSPQDAQYGTGGALLDRMAELFNAEWVAEGQTLVFENRANTGEQWLDLRAPEVNDLLVDGEVCYRPGANPPPFFGEYKYQQDAVDTVGNESEFLWSDIVPFDNPAALPGAAGSVQKTFAFSTFRARQDGLRPDPIKFWEGFIEGMNSFIGGDFDAPDHALLMQIGKTIAPKLILLEANYNPQNALPERRAVAGGNSLYNVPLWVAAGAYDTIYAEDAESDKVEVAPNLWEFHQDDDPRSGGQATKGAEVTFSLRKDCAFLAALYRQVEENGNLNLFVLDNYLGQERRIYINEVSINDDTIDVTGEL